MCLVDGISLFADTVVVVGATAVVALSDDFCNSATISAERARFAYRISMPTDGGGMVWGGSECVCTVCAQVGIVKVANSVSMRTLKSKQLFCSSI